MATRLNNKKSSKIGAFFRRNWIALIVVLLLLVLVVPFVVYKIQDFIANLKANNKDNETKVLVNNVKNDTVQNSAVNSNSSTSDLRNKFQQIKERFKYSKGLTPKLWESLKSDAENLAIALGTHAKDNKAIFGLDSHLPEIADSPHALFEDEKEAVRILKKYPKTFPILAEIYYKMFTRSHNLKSDLNKYLSKSDIAILRRHYKNYKTSWL